MKIEEKLKNKNGITLVSLVVTIIVLIILAGVSINAILGENGIITITKEAKQNVEQAQIKEQTELNELYKQIVAGGAVEVARGMYTGKKSASNENYGVVSTLCYSVQWGAALNFIDANYITNEVEGKPNCATDSYIANSTGKGWYTDNRSGNPNFTTGVDVDSKASNKVKNIYDMAGNVYEWTMEVYYPNARVRRGR